MGPTVWELEGPMPIEKRSSAETWSVIPRGYLAGGTGSAAGSRAPAAVRLALDKLILPELAHVVYEARK